ncbi:PfkB family carbohydrate kinase [Pelagicoccus sp. SDUM812003]|uniref:PfkB family carbohydrate kinase n=1 Tax=Pelagicoccus sp. SDUM812003 TaxID=3041267 RepID=UPI00281082AC|nr:PfkB family carbohydrate kinase [Pelagicoccus sp. SDUM812003]MDQ8203284.1 PfkB family carbohydrate kinase [Pelagicoccus sp. SDUM812003]
MDYRQRALQELSEKRSKQAGKRVLVGLDGFVDTILHLVAKRTGKGEDFTRMDTISDFGARINAAAGKSTNIEMFPKMEKLGGNGPIMANAMVAAGYPLRYIGSLGNPNIHPVFQDFAAKTNALSISEPGLTNAIEFTDGKIMMGITKYLEDITYDAIVEAMGEGALLDELSRCSMIALVNWTMIPNMTQIFEDLLSKALPSLPPLDGGRSFFFDLADPEKRSTGELVNALRVIGKFQSFGNAVLGLNLAEGQQVSRAFGIQETGEDAESLQAMAAAIRRELGLKMVVVHPKERAACATKDGEWCVEGPYEPNPKITTGAGDHFNAGFMSAQQLGLSPEACLTVGVSFSGFYVRTAKSPSLNDIDSFLRNW